MGWLWRLWVDFPQGEGWRHEAEGMERESSETGWERQASETGGASWEVNLRARAGAETQIRGHCGNPSREVRSSN